MNTKQHKRKCSRCHVNLPISAFKMKRSGEYKKQCELCCEKQKVLEGDYDRSTKAIQKI